ncbi:transmembrane amino acid transporter [Aspergillus campestris IBT 28561]|uniref:Transmembrane amino acid transporter n=1 Tax=Aspergillus campestris (strain IBT 28561) TaxID=1392248 RepID=A0A2I1D7Y7_ASPC2|nr:transmembrane amino acid transporter [Aspergillus campestris IBT 28561]PKY05992.1 transmembrane amino acid transporter [Aspergillus campestris IBT 28561]
MGDDLLKGEDNDQRFEVFQSTGDGVDFRVLSWQWASIIFLKLTFATGVMTIPGQLYILGAAPGSLVVLGWGIINTYAGVVQGNFRNRHPMCHSVADMAGVVGGPLLREVAGVCFIASWIICAASGINGATTALNALSDHATCTNWYALAVTAVVVLVASLRKFGELSWISWAGFVSVFAAVFIVVIGVTLRDRPAGAPQTGDYDFGYHAVAFPSFVQGISAAATLFSASAGTSAFLPVISEMRQPRDYKKSLYLCMLTVTAAYLSFGLVVYRWCGKWITTPSLGSAGPTLKKVSYGVGLLGIIVTGILYVHVSAKYIFVRILRGSTHLQSNTFTHWATWLSCTVGLSIVAFLLAAAIPIFNYLLGLAGSLGFAPIALILPPWLWIFDHGEWRTSSSPVKMVVYYLHWVWVLIGVFMTVGGTYGILQSVVDAYRSGDIGGTFSCADNS